MPALPQLHARHILGAVCADYLIDDEGRVGLRLLPSALRDQLATPRQGVPPPGESPWVRRLDPLLHVHARGWPLPTGFAAGRTLRHAGLTYGMKLHDQQIDEDAQSITIITTLAHDCGVKAEHRLSWQRECDWLRIHSSLSNHSPETLRLEFLSGAVLSDCNPFASDDAPGRLFLHRFRSTWSAEARHERCRLEDLHLERSWGAHSIQCERFGQAGSMPVRGFVPWVGLEDAQAGVIWALQPDAPASWQCDCLRREDGVSIAAGPADHELGHWWKDLAPGETYAAAGVSAVCVAGGIDEACASLVAAIDHGVHPPAVEDRAPVAFNEWCSSWGEPSHDSLCALADALTNSGITYLTIDAGWFLPASGQWHNAQGDWQANARAFPQGIAATAAAIRKRGLIPGLWFEWEVVGRNSSLWNRADWLLQRGGVPITVGDRRFLDLRLGAVRAYLRQAMIDLLREAGIGYLKMDYNESTGIGPDGRHGPGAELESAILAAQEFVRELRQELPDLVIECCASGGHRLEPSWLRLVSQASFSDAHESRGIPIVAANALRIIPARQNQIWAVLRASDDAQRLIWSLSAGFLGRLCCSGDLLNLNAQAQALLRQAVAFAAAAAPLIHHGRIRRSGHAEQGSWNHPSGHQVLTFHYQNRCLVVAHAYADAPQRLSLELPPGPWQAVQHFAGDDACIDQHDIRLPGSGDRAGAWIMERP